MTEVWKQVIDWEGFYEVSDHGNVRSVDRTTKGPMGFQNLRGRVLKAGVGVGGRLQVVFCKEGITYNQKVHRLILEAFVGPCPVGFEACHYDGNPANNKLYNLRWDTRLGNNLDRRRHRAAGKPVRRSDGVEFANATEASENTPGAHQSNISACCLGRKRYLTCAGFTWEFI